MGMGKNPPDETQVRQNANLALPPDLQLPAPSEAVETAVTGATASPQPLSNPPADNLGMDPLQDMNTGAAASSTGGSGPAASPAATPAAPTALRPAAGNPRENAFAKYGISKTRPDGKPKTEGELNKELLAAIQAEKRRQDPKHGTIFNIGGLFGGD
jgi:hypothetical protein